MGIRVFLFFIFSRTFAHHVVIIIPGTWAANAAWYKPGGDFFEAAKLSASGSPVVAFNWSCKITPYAREVAAKQLVTVLESYPQNTEFTIIAHSHGGNVGILASQKLKHCCIISFYALGTPVSNGTYYPNMDAIKNFYNLFSWEDVVQPLVGYQRVYNAHPRVWNISVKVDGVSPQHIDLHHPLIGKWVFYVEKIFDRNEYWATNFKDVGIDFWIEYNRVELLEEDAIFMAKYPDLFTGRERALFAKPVS